MRRVNRQWNSNGYTDRNATIHTYCEPECNTEPEPHRNSYSQTYFNPAAPPDATPTADSTERRQSVANES